MIKTSKLRELSLAVPIEVGRQAHLSAASGLVRFKDYLYVIADDELHLGIFSIHPEEFGALYPIFPGQLPLDHHQRKREKLDLESLALIAPTDDRAATLLAVPSGSKPQRTTGASILLNSGGLPTFVQSIDFGPLYRLLSERFSELNIEGSVVSNGSLKLFQRGNGAGGQNAVIDLDLARVMDGLKNRQIPAGTLRGTRSYELGALNGVRLSFTDAASLEGGRVVFVAAAEESRDTYNDGACKGSVVGMLDASGNLVFIGEVSNHLKFEGMWAERSDQGVELLLVTDGDDSSKTSELFSCRLDPIQ